MRAGRGGNGSKLEKDGKMDPSGRKKEAERDAVSRASEENPARVQVKKCGECYEKETGHTY